jgi:fatty-acyl-CoA synthase
MGTKLERSYVHRGGEQPLIGDTIDGYLSGVVRRYPDQEAIVSVEQGKRLSYSQLDQEVDRLARGLLALGFGRGDRVGIWSTDNIEWVLLQLATARIGAVLVNINPAYRIQELEHALRLARVQGLFLIPSFRSSNYVGMVSSLAPELETQPADELRLGRLPDLRRVVVYDPMGRYEQPASGVLRWADVIEHGEALPPDVTARQAASLDPDDPINIQFTSGTTGFPKAVVLTHHNILNNGFFVSEQMGFTPADRLCVPVPFYHCFGMVISNLGCLTHGSTIVIPTEHFEAGAVLRAIAQERCTAVHGVPAMFVAELEHPEFDGFELTSLRTGIMAGAPCPPELMRRVIRDMGIGELRIAYGQTEASPVTHMTRRVDSFERRVETVGTNLPHQEVKVVDVDSGAVLPVGQQGEICFRGYHVMSGYYDQPEATAQAIEPGGWLHSGDLGVMDEDGYVRITGRIKEMIIRGGENIYPAEIEAFYYTHPAVAEVAVFGVPDERLGEEVGAWIKLKEEASASAEELREFARERIAHFKVPRYLWIVDEFPTTVTGKVQKYRITEIVEGWLGEGVRSA